MNAFTRQEITAITPSRSGKGWSRVQASTATQPYQYHAVVNAMSRCIVAYQAAETESPIHSALEQTILRIERSPAGRPLLLTLNVQDYLEEEHGQGNRLLALLQQYLWSDRELIVHLDHANDDVWRSIELYKRLQMAGIPTMVDAGRSWDLPSINILLDAHIVRFNAEQLTETVEQLLGLTQKMGVLTMLTDISNESQVKWAIKQGIDWLQVDPAKSKLI